MKFKDNVYSQTCCLENDIIIHQVYNPSRLADYDYSEDINQRFCSTYVHTLTVLDFFTKKEYGKFMFSSETCAKITANVYRAYLDSSVKSNFSFSENRLYQDDKEVFFNISKSRFANRLADITIGSDILITIRDEESFKLFIKMIDTPDIQYMYCVGEK